MCTGLVQLLHLQPERLALHMHDIIEYMLESTQVTGLPASLTTFFCALASACRPLRCWSTPAAPAVFCCMQPAHCSSNRRASCATRRRLDDVQLLPCLRRQHGW